MVSHRLVYARPIAADAALVNQGAIHIGHFVTGTIGEHNRPFNRLDNIGKANVARLARQDDTATRTARGHDQFRFGQQADQFLSRGQGQSGFIGQLPCAVTLAIAATFL